MSHSGIPACPTCGERLSGLRYELKKQMKLSVTLKEDDRKQLVVDFRKEHEISECCMLHLTQCVELNEIMIRKN